MQTHLTHSDASISTERTFPRIKVNNDSEPPDLSGGSLPQNFSQEDDHSISTRFTPLPTPTIPTIPTIPTTASMLGEDEPNGYLDQEEHIRQFIGNLGNY